MNVETRRRHIKAATSLNDIAVTTVTEERQQARSEEKEDYETLDRLIDSITRESKEERKEESVHIEDTRRLVT